MNINNKSILLTGGGSGIGKALTKALYELDNKIVVVGRSLEKLNSLKKELPKITCYSYDLSDKGDILNLIETINDRHDDLSVLINNAGIMEIEKFSSTQHDPLPLFRQMETNFFAPIRLIHGLLPLLLKQTEPAIINVTTALVYVPFAATPAYCSSKSALSSYTKSLRIQHQDHGLHVFEILPPLVQTDMATSLGKSGMNVSKFAQKVIKGLRRNRYEIRPGQAKALFLMHKFFTRFIQKQMNKSAFQILDKAN